MLVKIDEVFCEVPQVYSFRFKDKKNLQNMIDSIRQHLFDVWGLESSSEAYYGFDFICNAIEDLQRDSQFINNCIVDYINRGNNSAFVIEQFLMGINLSQGRLKLFDSTLILVFQNLLNIYNEGLRPFEEDFIVKEAVKLFIETVFLEIAIWSKVDYYYSVEEFVDLYNNLIFNEFYDQRKKVSLNINTVRNLISKLKKNPQYEDSILNINGKNYIGKKIRYHVERDVPSFKKLYLDSRLAIYKEDCQKAYDLIDKQKRNIENSYQAQLSLENEKDVQQWNSLLDTYSNKRLFLLIEINIVLLILDDVLDSLNNRIVIEDFQSYESSFWERFSDELEHYKREDFQKLYYSILSFVYLYVHRIRLGAMSYNWFENLGNTNADIQYYIDIVRESFKGAKRQAVFSKLFKKFYINTRGNFERILLESSDWKAIKLFIKEHIKAEKFTYEYSQIEENLNYSDEKIGKFSKQLLVYFNGKIEIAEKKISSLNIDKEEMNVTSWIGSPPDEKVNVSEGIMIGHFQNKDSDKELGKIQNGKYETTSFDNLTYPGFASEFRYKYKGLFDKVAYEYQIRNNNGLIEKGIIYFFDLDERCGRYKLFPNEEHPKIELEKRYGRFEYWSLEGRLKLTGNGLNSYLGQPIYLYHFMDLQHSESISKKTYSKQLGVNIWFEFEKIII